MTGLTSVEIFYHLKEILLEQHGLRKLKLDSNLNDGCLLSVFDCYVADECHLTCVALFNVADADITKIISCQAETKANNAKGLKNI